MLFVDESDITISPEIKGGRALVSAILRQAVQDLDIRPITGKRKLQVEQIRQSARNFLRSAPARECAASLGIMPGSYTRLLVRHGIND